MRHRNRDLVLEALRRRGGASQADVSRITGLSRSTVSTLVAELRSSGFVVEIDEPDELRSSSVQGGRPPVLLTLDPSAGAAVGIDFGHSHVRVAIADLGHRVLLERERGISVDGDPVGSLDVAAALAAELMAECGIAASSVMGVGMGVPGPVNHRTGRVGSSSILPGWLGFQAAQEMERRLGIPVAVDNDANLGALGEVAWGEVRDCSDLAYIKVSSGIGAGLVLGGRLHRGANGTAGEIGHDIVDEAGPFCRCGNRGCLEAVAGGAAIIELLSRSRGESLSLGRIVELAGDGDLACRRVLAEVGRQIGVAVAKVCNLVNPERVVIGGLLSRAGDVLLEPMRESVRRFAVDSAMEAVEIVPSMLGERAGVLGALALVLREESPAFGVRLRAQMQAGHA
ncbi:MAG: ROK family transcriptional regulator [Candidatus Dormibacteraceae bacterium]